MAIIHLEMTDQASKPLMDAAGKHIPFAIAKSLTRTAQQSQKHIRQSIGERFFIRKRSGGFASSIRIQPATKKSLTAKVYSMAGFAALQQTGGTKKSHQGRLAIPIYDDLRDVKKRSSRHSPQAYLAGDAFILSLASGDEAIAKRNKGGLKILYLLTHTASVPKRLDMVEETTRITRHHFALHFNQALREAL